jgi:hypothetical protein
MGCSQTLIFIIIVSSVLLEKGGVMIYKGDKDVKAVAAVKL